MKYLFSFLLLYQTAFSRDLFIISGPKEQRSAIESLARKIAIEEPFTETLIRTRIEKSCEIQKESLLQICITQRGEQKIVHTNTVILNRIFKEIKKEELSKESSNI